MSKENLAKDLILNYFRSPSRAFITASAGLFLLLVGSTMPTMAVFLTTASIAAGIVSTVGLCSRHIDNVLNAVLYGTNDLYNDREVEAPELVQQDPPLAIHHETLAPERVRPSVTDPDAPPIDPDRLRSRLDGTITWGDQGPGTTASDVGTDDSTPGPQR